jgi:hypothetical protein
MEQKPVEKQGLMKFEDMTPEGQGLLRVYSIIEKLLGKVVNMDANEAVAFVEARQWLTHQAQVLARRERALFDAKAKAVAAVETPPAPAATGPKLEVIDGEKKE